jgi:hypothetical protein
MTLKGASRRGGSDLPELDQQRCRQCPGGPSRPPGRGDNPTSWNSAHNSRGCSQSNLRTTGGNGYFYCFAADQAGAGTFIQESLAPGQPTHFALRQNYPNPFNSQTVFRFALAQRRAVELGVYNLAGQKMATLASGWREAGNYVVRWDGRHDDGRGLASGIYLYRLEMGDRAETRKLACRAQDHLSETCICVGATPSHRPGSTWCAITASGRPRIAQPGRANHTYSA